MKTLMAVMAVCCTGVLSGCTGSAKGADEQARYERRWFYSMFNLQVGENADELIGLMKRARSAGYNGVVLADYKLNILDRVPEHYFVNVNRVKQAASEIGIELIPAVFPVGYSSGLLAHDPNLAEGVPVVRAPFQVRNAVAELERPAEAILKNGGFEEARGDAFGGFSFQDDPGAGSYADEEVKREGKNSMRLEAAGKSANRRIMQQVAVRKNACYRLTAWVKTAGLSPTGSFRLLALSAGEGGRPLTYYEADLKPTQEWQRLEVVFNSLDEERVNIYAGIWGKFQGKLWVDQIELEELSLVNVLRREGCPLKVESAVTDAVYEEGRDFERVVDVKLGMVPYAGEYEFSHDPALLRISHGSRIKEGEKLLVSWYHPLLVHGNQVMCCPSEPKVMELLRDQARRVNELFAPRTFFMSHDEIRVLNWDRSCLDRKATPGEILAANAKECLAILKEVVPGAEVVVWSDMFDPFHNAVDDYYLVNGTLAGSWEGLPDSVVVANWNGGKKRQSLEFFARRGNRQVIAGYYDADDLSNFKSWTEAAAGVQGVDGFMYTTWQRRFELLEEHGRAMRSRD